MASSKIFGITVSIFMKYYFIDLIIIVDYKSNFVCQFINVLICPYYNVDIFTTSEMLINFN